MTKKIIEEFSQLQDLHVFHRLGKLFTTRQSSYFYDSGTGKVFACENKELELLQLLLEHQWATAVELVEEQTEYEQALINIYALMDQEQILKLPQYTRFTNENGDDDIYQNGQLKQCTLEVTQKCNLRCKYCIYHEDYAQYRTFGTSDMDWETAKAALDYANEHGSNDLIIGFYGGEPLMNFDLIKNSIAYCLATFHTHPELYFTMTSNLTMLTEQMAEYLASVPNMNIVCSLDGPKEIQDRFRVFPDAVGSFERTLAGLRLLCEKMGAQAEQRISIHSVLCPPFIHNKFDKLKSFFRSIPWLPTGIGKNIAYVGAGSLKVEDGGISQEEGFASLHQHSMKEIDPLKYWALQELCDQEDWGYAFQIEHSSLMKMHTRSILDEPAQRLFRNACCSVGIRKLYVSVDGNMTACERIGNSPSLGNVKTGLDRKRIQTKYMEEYDRYSLQRCNACWALHLCNQCYALCYDEDGLNEEKKDRQCEVCRKNVEFDLIEYYQLLEERPEVIERLDQILERGS